LSGVRKAWKHPLYEDPAKGSATARWGIFRGKGKFSNYPIKVIVSSDNKILTAWPSRAGKDMIWYNNALGLI
jgi:hypothetical protein